jgi:hypothetical protein
VAYCSTLAHAVEPWRCRSLGTARRSRRLSMRRSLANSSFVTESVAELQVLTPGHGGER